MRLTLSACALTGAIPHYYDSSLTPVRSIDHYLNQSLGQLRC